MPKITLIDGSILNFDKSISIKDIAKSISSSLAKNAIAGKINGKLVDTFFIVENDANIQIITDKDQEGIDIIRHSAAHLLAYAVKILHPNAKYTIGPTIENGFYYDFDYENSFTLEDLKIIEKKMHDLAKANHQVTAEEITRENAIKLFTKLNEPYKVEIIKSIPENERLTLYKEGEYVDLCRGPHVPSTGKIKAFKLLKVSGAYWRGNSKNKMLQRIYGTAWANQNQLDEYLFKLAEAEKRDHRKLAKQLDLFHLQEEAPGMVFWHPKGWTIWQTIEQYLRCELKKEGYLEIKTPMVMNKILWEKSGHWDHYKENMFITESEKHTYAIKPMNCPGHIEVFKNGLKSYRDLPLRLSEFGSCHRNEPSGSLHGLLRVRGFVQDDAHIFCTIDQIIEETKNFHKLITRVYNKFGFHDLDIKLSLRPEKKAGNDALWDKAENNLRNALKACDINFEELKGEGAFYGPKVEYHIKDAIGRSWQCGTIQLDFVLPERLNAEYIDEKNTKKHPVMLHRAVLGTLERFIGILIEHYMGNFPLWLAPIQIIIMNITNNQINYCKKIAKQLEEANFRVSLDIRNEKIGFKIREHSLQKIPYHIIIGDKELEENTISIRKSGKDLGSIKIEDFIFNLNKEL